MNKFQQFFNVLKKNWLVGVLFFVLLTALIVFFSTGSLENLQTSKTANQAQNSQKQNEIYSSTEPVVIYGDTRTGQDIHRKIIEQIIKVNPLAVFNTGDVVENGDNPADWQAFNEITGKLRATVPYYPALGNHDKEAKLYFENFSLPNNERWYAVNYEKIHFIVLDTNLDISIGSKQYQWLENDFKNQPDDTLFTVAIFHHPPFSTGLHQDDEKYLQVSIVPLFENYGMDMVFSAHNHGYERSQVRGIYYIVSAGGGAPLYPQIRTSPYSQKFLETYNFCTLEIAQNHLVFKAYDLNGVLIDQVKI